MSDVLRNHTYEIWKSPEDGLWRGSICAPSGDRILTSEGYPRQTGAMDWMGRIADGTFERFTLLRAYAELMSEGSL